jgi:dTDP-4-dehydrorhamnose reductase
MAAERAGFDPGLVAEAGDGPALNTVLATERGILMPNLDSALDRFFADNEMEWSADTLKLAAE